MRPSVTAVKIATPDEYKIENKNESDNRGMPNKSTVKKHHTNQPYSDDDHKSF